MCDSECVCVCVCVCVYVCVCARIHTHAHTHASDEGIGTAVKNILEIIVEQVRLEGGFKRGGKNQRGEVFEN